MRPKRAARRRRPAAEEKADAAVLPKPSSTQAFGNIRGKKDGGASEE
jgi:hypothetical protein